MKKLLFLGCFCLLGCGENQIDQPGIFLSFDDRSIEEWSIIDTLFKEYQFRATFYITQFDSLTVSEIQALKRLAMSGHQIGFHGSRHLNAETFIRNHGYSEYLQVEIDSGLERMKSEGFVPTSFAYPYGADFWFTDMLLFRRFSSTRRVESLGNRQDLTKIDDIFLSFSGSRTLTAIGIDANSGIDEDMISTALDYAIERKKSPNAICSSAYKKSQQL